MAPRKKTTSTSSVKKGGKAATKKGGQKGEKKSPNAKKWTTKKAILDLLAQHDTEFVGLPTIKKLLAAEYGFTAGAAFNKRVLKTLKSLEAENRDDFMKWGGSYTAGAHCPANAERQAKESREADLVAKARQGLIQCPYCQFWIDGMVHCMGEDSIARGAVYSCPECGKTCYSWISDQATEPFGHKKEYKYSKYH